MKVTDVPCKLVHRYRSPQPRSARKCQPDPGNRHRPVNACEKKGPDWRPTAPVREFITPGSPDVSRGARVAGKAQLSRKIRVQSCGVRAAPTPRTFTYFQRRQIYVVQGTVDRRGHLMRHFVMCISRNQNNSAAVKCTVTRSLPVNALVLAVRARTGATKNGDHETYIMLN